MEDVPVLPIIFVLIEGTPKHVPITTVHPTIPLTNGSITLFPNPECTFFAFS